jgi:hypothetical protein
MIDSKYGETRACEYATYLLLQRTAKQVVKVAPQTGTNEEATYSRDSRDSVCWPCCGVNAA